jgi:hypothetical protein
MGGIGSGKYNKWKTKPTTANYNSLDLRKLNKLVTLDHLCGFTLEWNKNNEVTSSVDCIFDNNVLEIHYSIEDKNGKVSNIDYVPIVKTPCHFGGERKWLVCPGCHNNALVLYVVNRFRCRKCHGLYHPSSNEGEFYRATRAMCNIQDKLNGKELRPLDGAVGLSKPKWMRYNTYFKLHNEAYLRQKKLFNEYRRAFSIFGDY